MSVLCKIQSGVNFPVLVQAFDIIGSGLIVISGITEIFIYFLLTTHNCDWYVPQTVLIPIEVLLEQICISPHGRYIGLKFIQISRKPLSTGKQLSLHTRKLILDVWRNTFCIATNGNLSMVPLEIRTRFEFVHSWFNLRSTL